MNPQSLPHRLLLIDIDGLRQDVFHQVLRQGRAPHLARLLGEPDQAIHLDPVSCAPSITFTAQSSLFTGLQPELHGIQGNQFFDRHGLRGAGPRFYAFDVGDALAYDDAVLTFSGEVGLLGQTLSPQAPTIYERAARRGLSSSVIYNMVSRGATHWIKPSLLDIARFTKGGGLLGLSAEQYDHEMIDKTIAHLRAAGQSDLLTIYFMGLDHHSHEYGPGVQADYLANIVDREIGRLADELEGLGDLSNCLVGVISDHGQIEVVPDDRHSPRMSYPFDREMGYLFDALGLDVNDKPREGPETNAVVASNGGLAHIYLRHRGADWQAAPRFLDDIRPVAAAFWNAHETGKYSADLQDALAMVLVRDVEHDGWHADYQAFTPQGQLQSISAYLAEHPQIETVDAPARLRCLASPGSGDILLVSNYAGGFYFGGITTGVHGGLHPAESLCVGSLGWIGADHAQLAVLRATAQDIVRQGRQSEGRDHASVTDIAQTVCKILGI